MPISRPSRIRSFSPTAPESASPDDGATRPQRFDPALAQLPSAFRPGDPTFPDPATAWRWAELRRAATDHVLRRIAESPFGDRLILRGSRLQKAWFGDQAREPGDLDWVFDLGSGDDYDQLPEPSEFFEGMIEAVFAGPSPAGVELVRDAMATDAVWTYDRAPGRRGLALADCRTTGPRRSR